MSRQSVAEKIAKHKENLGRRVWIESRSRSALNGRRATIVGVEALGYKKDILYYRLEKIERMEANTSRLYKTTDVRFDAD